MTLTNPTRKHIVKEIRVRAEKRGSFGYPPKEAFDGGEEPETVWVVTLRIQEGLLPEHTVWMYLRSEQEADKVKSEYPVGSEYPYVSPFLEIDLDKWIAVGFFPIAGGDEELYLPWQVLMDAGISDENGLHASKMVLDYLGKERIEELKKKYGENWQAVAEYEYCYKNTSNSSPAFVAAAARFCYFVLENDFKAGYLLRDLEVLVNGVESEAAKAMEMRKKAGGAGGKTSRKARDERRADLIDKIETVAARNPDMIRIGAEALAKLAVEDCERENPTLWSQGKGQTVDYLGEIRRGEAGESMKERYQALFGSKPPKRFK